MRTRSQTAVPNLPPRVLRPRPVKVKKASPPVPPKPSHPRKPRPTSYTCRICIEEKPTDSFIKWTRLIRSYRRRYFQSHFSAEIPGDCIPHLARNPRRRNDPVCKTCIGASMSARLESLGARSVGTGCLEPGCETMWTIDFIIKYLPANVLEDFNMSMFPVWKETAPLVHCVNESCGASGIAEWNAPGYPQLECVECKTRMCATCKVAWHTTFSCADYAARHVNEQMTTPEKETLDFMQTKDGKRCPNCYLVIEKDGGCDSMFCTGCKKFFNWSTASSAVPGSKPIEPPIMIWGQTLGCEIDGLVGANGQAGVAAVN